MLFLLFRDMFLTTVRPSPSANLAMWLPTIATKAASEHDTTTTSTHALSVVEEASTRLKQHPFFVNKTLFPPVPGEPLRKPVAALYLGIMRAIDLVDDLLAAGRNITRTFVRVVLPLLLLCWLLLRWLKLM